jgi:hypothetical protein
VTDLANLILARIRSRGDRVVRAGDLCALSTRSGYDKHRHVDKTLQSMRRRGLIRYDSKLGWLEVVARSPENAATDQRIDHAERMNETSGVSDDEVRAHAAGEEW